MLEFPASLNATTILLELLSNVVAFKASFVLAELNTTAVPKEIELLAESTSPTTQVPYSELEPSAYDNAILFELLSYANEFLFPSLGVAGTGVPTTPELRACAVATPP